MATPLTLDGATGAARPASARHSGGLALPTFYARAGHVLPWCWGAAAFFGLAGLLIGLVIALPDPMQGDAYRIVFVHVPAAWMSMFIYLVMASCAGAGLALHSALLSMLAAALAPTGATMAFLALWTGALWGKPIWGAWWTWDARLASELLLLLLYLAFMALRAANDDVRRGDRAAALLALAGLANLPLIYFSVQWWNTLHRGAGAGLAHTPSVATMMVSALVLMIVAFTAWSMALALHRVRSLLLEREASSEWVRQLPEVRS